VSTLNTTLAIIGGAITLLVLVGGAAALIRASYSKARVDALREDNSDLRARVGDIDMELDRQKTRADMLEQKLTHVKAENDLLKDLVTQRANVEAIADVLDFHHKESMEAWEKICKTIKDNHHA
jgi:chromosome segregation ATPase